MLTVAIREPSGDQVATSPGKGDAFTSVPSRSTTPVPKHEKRIWEPFGDQATVSIQAFTAAGSGFRKVRERCCQPRIVVTRRASVPSAALV